MSGTTNQNEYTQYGDITPRTAAFAVKKFLKRAVREQVVDKFAQFTEVPKNKTKVVKWRRYNALPRVTTALSEGVNPETQKITCTDVTATLAQYGGITSLTDVVQDTHEDPVLQQSIQIISENAGESLEAIKIGILSSCTNKYYCGTNAVSKATVSGIISLAKLRLVNRAFQRNRAKKFTEIISGTTKISTTPIGASYILLGHTDLETDFRNITGFVPVEKYGTVQKVSEYEIGSIENFRIVLTSMFEPEKQAGASGTTLLSNGEAPSTAAAADVYHVFAIAKDAYAFTPLAGKNAATISVINPNKPSAFDPLGQKGYIGWKAWMSGAVLNDLWMADIECGCTAVYS